MSISIPIIRVLNKYNYPITKSGDNKCKTIALWRNGEKFNVIVNLDTNHFYDFVTNEGGYSYELFCLINELDKNQPESKIHFHSEFTSFYKNENKNELSNHSFKKICENEILEKKILLENLYNSAYKLFDDHYFNKKGVELNKYSELSTLIRQIKLPEKLVSQLYNNGISDKNLSIVIPIFSIKDFSLINLQLIQCNGEKKFISDYELKHSFFPIYSTEKIYNLFNSEIIIVCEGVATGYSVLSLVKSNQIKKSISYTIISCTTANGLIQCVDYLLSKNKKVIILSDIDSETEVNNKVMLGACFKYFKRYLKNVNVLNITPMFNNYYTKITNINNISDFNDLEFIFGTEFCFNIIKKSILNYLKLTSKNEIFLKMLPFNIIDLNHKQIQKNQKNSFNFNDSVKILAKESFILFN